MVETKGYKTAKGFKFVNDENLWKNMLCYFKCDNSMVDETGNIELVQIGSPSYTTGKLNQAIDITNNNFFRFKKPLKHERQMSFGMWKNFDDFGDDASWSTCLRGIKTNHYLIATIDGEGVEPAGQLGVYVNNGGNFHAGTLNINDYSGYHWLYVEVDNTGDDSYTGETRIYIDNVLSDTINVAAYDESGIQGFLSYQAGIQSFGICDEIFIKNGFLTETQRTAIYNSGDGISLTNTQVFPNNSLSLDKYTGRKIFTDEDNEFYVPNHTHDDSSEGTTLDYEDMKLQNMFKSLAYINYFQETNASINLSTQNFDDLSTGDVNGTNDTVNTTSTDADYDTLGGNDGYISKTSFTTYNFNDDNGNIARMVTPIKNYKLDYSYHGADDENWTETTTVVQSGNTETIHVYADHGSSRGNGSADRNENFSYYFPLLDAYNNTREFTISSYTNWTEELSYVGEAGVKISFDGYVIINKGNAISGGDNTEGTTGQTIKLVKEVGGNVLLYINNVLSYTSVTGVQTLDFQLESSADAYNEDSGNGDAAVTIQTYNTSQLTTINKPYLENPYGWYERFDDDYDDGADDRNTENYTITYTDNSITMDNDSDAYADDDTSRAEYSRTDIMHIPLIDGEKRKVYLNTYVYANGDDDANVYGKATLRLQANTTTFFNIAYNTQDNLSNSQYFYIFAERTGNTINYYNQDGVTLITTHSGTEGLLNIYTYTYEEDDDNGTTTGSSSARTYVKVTYPTNGFVDSIVATNTLGVASSDINYAVVYTDFTEDTDTSVTVNLVNGSNRINDITSGELIDITSFSGNTNLEFNLKTTDSAKTAKLQKYSVVWY